MFSLKEFIRTGLLKAVGEMADYKIILNAAAWQEKGVLNEGDLAQIEARIKDNEEARAAVTVEEVAE